MPRQHDDDRLFRYPGGRGSGGDARITDLVGEQFFGHDIESSTRTVVVGERAGKRLAFVERDVAVSHAGVFPEVAGAETEPHHVPRHFT